MLATAHLLLQRLGDLDRASRLALLIGVPIEDGVSEVRSRLVQCERDVGFIDLLVVDARADGVRLMNRTCESEDVVRASGQAR